MATERESHTFWLEYLPSWTDFSHFFNFSDPPRPSLEGFLVISSILQIPLVYSKTFILKSVHGKNYSGCAANFLSFAQLAKRRV